ncbi:MAG: 2-succinyl-5-enolpyruvyl-6-hydroxy-3-cyclohexene-1-carboxylic-acid synthase [Kofleriaceae bacterium]
MTAAVQTIWAELIAASLGDAGVTLCVVSPGSRSTPLVAAFAASRLELVTIIDERTAGFYALGAARATGKPVALVCTSGSAAAHYLPALVEAAMAHVPLVVLTANRPPELHDCGASQTIEQRDLYIGFTRARFDLGAPVGSELALRAVRRKVIQAVTLAQGPDPGPVHLDVPLRKPLEPAAPSTDGERALAALTYPPALVAPPVLAGAPAAIAALGRAIAGEPRGVIVAGAMPVGFAAARDAVFALALRAGYPIVAEAGSQLRFGPRPDGVCFVDHFDLIPAGHRPAPAIGICFGAEPVSAAWPSVAIAARWVLAGSSWHDGDSTATVILGDVAQAIAAIPEPLADTRRSVERAAASAAWLADWREADARAAAAVTAALAVHPRSEACVMRAAIAALPAGAIVQIGNSLPIRVVDQVCGARTQLAVITQRGAAGIDGTLASAAGATRAGKPVLVVLGDVSFAHDLGGLLAARSVAAPLAILVIDNRGGQIFAGLPIARAELGDAFERHWLTLPELDPAAVATAIGLQAITAASPAAAASAIEVALAAPGVTVIHAPVVASGAHDVRRFALAHHVPEPVLAKLGEPT